LNIPLGGEFVSKVKSVADVSRIVTVCRTGTRSLSAAYELRENGIPAQSLNGGMVAWSNMFVTSDLSTSNDQNVRVFQMKRLSKGCSSYLLGDGEQCIVIDPSSRVDEYIQFASSEGLRITHVIDTHRHADHISGGRLLASATGAGLWLSAHTRSPAWEHEPSGK